MRLALLCVIAILTQMRGCVEDEARRGDPAARALVDNTSATLTALYDYGAGKAERYTPLTREQIDWAWAHRDELTSMGLVHARGAATEAFRRAADYAARASDLPTSAGLAADDMREAGDRAARRLREAFEAAKRKL